MAGGVQKVFRYGCAREKSVGEIRLLREHGTKSVKDGGWHFTSVGGIDSIKMKIESWGHQEFNNDSIKNNIEQRVREGKDIFFRDDTPYVRVELDSSFPDYLTQNLQLYSNLVLDE